MAWSYQYTPYIWPMLTGASLSAAVAIYSWRHRNVPGATGLASIGLFWVPKLLASALAISVATLPRLSGLCLNGRFDIATGGKLKYQNRGTWSSSHLPFHPIKIDEQGLFFEILE